MKHPLPPAEELERSSAAFIADLEKLQGTSDAARLLDALGTTERALAGVYERLAASHERAAVADLTVSTAGFEAGPARWIRADAALRTAAALSRAAADALARAHHDEAIALWFDAVEADG